MEKKLLCKQYFNIKDLASIVKKETQTIRSWEKKNIIAKPDTMSDHGKIQWREYSREALANVLEQILKYPWERQVIKNKNEIQFLIDYFRGNIDYNFKEE